MRTRILWSHSVRVRLTAWYVAWLTAMLLVLFLGVHYIVRTGFAQQLGRRFERGLVVLADLVQEEPVALKWFDTHTTIDYFSVRSEKLVYESEEWRSAQLSTVDRQASLLDLWPWANAPEPFFVYRSREVSTSKGVWHITMAQDASAYERTLRDLTTRLLFVTPGALFLVTLGGYFMAGRVLSPVKVMALKARQISAENLSQRLPVEDPKDEFGQLATVFNSTLERLEDSFARLRRFTANASHELRTPLTAIRAVGEVGLAEPFDADRCRDAVGSMLEETDRLARLVEGLLFLAKADAGVVPKSLQPVPLYELVAEVVELLDVLAEEKAQMLMLDGDDRPIACTDRMILKQALINIVDNALRHTPDGGTVSIHTGYRDHRTVFVSVRDEGPGIAPQHCTQIFDRFYRVEGQRSSNGFGLGLSIAQWAVTAINGVIELETSEGKGSVFRIVIPVEHDCALVERETSVPAGL